MINLRYLLGFILLFVCGVSLASGTDLYHFNYTQSLLCDPNNPGAGYCDMSLKMLGSVFGTVGSNDSVSSLPGNGMIAMGYMFRVFNEGICGVIGLLTSYGVFNFAIRSAQDGMQGESRKAITSLLRIVFAISLVLPQATGYSLMQRLVMKTVVYGAGLADGIYRGVLTGMADGAIVLFHRSSAPSGVSASSLSQGDAALSESEVSKVLRGGDKDQGQGQSTVVKGIFQAEVCQAVSNKYVRQLSNFSAYGAAVAGNFSSDYNFCQKNKDLLACLKQKNLVFNARCNSKNGSCDIPAGPSDAIKEQANLTDWFKNKYMAAFVGPKIDNSKSLPRSYKTTDKIGYSTDMFGGGNTKDSQNKYCADDNICFSGFVPGSAAEADPESNYSANNSNCGSLSIPVKHPTIGGKLTPEGKQQKYMAGPVHVLMESLQSPVDDLVNASYPQESNPTAHFNSILANQTADYNDLLVLNPCVKGDTDSSECSDYKNTISSVTSNSVYAAINYVQLIKPILRVIEVSNHNQTNADLTAFQKSAARAGWVVAGRYYFDIIRLNNYLQNISTSITGHDVLKKFKAKPVIADADNPLVSGDGGFVEDYQKFITAKKFRKQIKHQLHSLSGEPKHDAPKSGVVDAAVSMFDPDAGSLSGMLRESLTRLYSTSGPGLALLIPMTNAMSNIAGFFDEQQGIKNPIVFIHQLGMKMLNEVLHGMMITNTVIMVVSLGANICRATSPIGPAVDNTIAWVSGMAKTMVGPIIMAGAVCAYYVPMYPFLVFTFGVISWLVSVIDAMIAMPLVCLGLAHPDGHEFMGKAEGATMLLMGVFIRPAVMIFAFISAMAVSYVALRLLNIGFMGVLVSGLGTGMQLVHGASDAVNTAISTSKVTSIWGLSSGNTHFGFNPGQMHSATGGAPSIKAGILAALNGAQYEDNQTSLINLIAIPSLFIIYTLMVYSVVTQCFGMMSELVTGVLKWVGGPQMGDNSLQLANQIQGAVGSGGSSLGGVASSESPNWSKVDRPQSTPGQTNNEGNKKTNNSKTNNSKK